METGYSIFHNLIIKASEKEVFDAVSKPHHLNNWWTLECNGAPTLDAEYNLSFGPQYNWFGIVSKCIPNTEFYIKMTKADADWNDTTFGFSIKPAKIGTQIEFSHTDWKNPNPHFKHSSFCWALLLNGLKNYLEKGIIVPFEDRS